MWYVSPTSVPQVFPQNKLTSDEQGNFSAHRARRKDSVRPKRMIRYHAGCDEHHRGVESNGSLSSPNSRWGFRSTTYADLVLQIKPLTLI